VDLEGRSLLVRTSVVLVRSVFDRDGDGYAALFGGADCDDRNPRIHPWANDDPATSFREDCFTGDLPLPTKWVNAEDAKEIRSSGQPNILVVTIDSLRADVLRDPNRIIALPTFLALQESSVSFSRATTPASRTALATSAWMRGRYPAEIRYDGTKDWPNVVSRFPTVMQPMRAAGYRVGALIESDFFKTLSGYFDAFDLVTQADREVKPVPSERDRLEREFEARFFVSA